MKIYNSETLKMEGGILLNHISKCATFRFDTSIMAYCWLAHNNVNLTTLCCERSLAKVTYELN